MENWQKVVSEIRRKLGVSEVELAQRIGCSQPTINRIANGQRNPGYKIGTKLMFLYDMDKAA